MTSTEQTLREQNADLRAALVGLHDILNWSHCYTEHERNTMMRAAESAIAMTEDQ